HLGCDLCGCYLSIGMIGPGIIGPGTIGSIRSIGGRGIGMISQYKGTCQPGGAGLTGHGKRGGRGGGIIRSPGSGLTTMGAVGSGVASVACAGAALKSRPTAAIAENPRRRDSFIWNP